jgi:hypothetical protein
LIAQDRIRPNSVPPQLPAPAAPAAGLLLVAAGQSAAGSAAAPPDRHAGHRGAALFVHGRRGCGKWQEAPGLEDRGGGEQSRTRWMAAVDKALSGSALLCQFLVLPPLSVI